MTEEQEKHVKSTEVWVKTQKNFIENLQIALDNSVRMVKNHQEVIDLHSVEIPIEVKFLEDGKRNFREWCETGELDAPEWCK